MKLTKNDWSAFANADLNTFDLSSFDIDKSMALNSLAEDLREEFEDFNSIETKQARLNHFKISGATLEDFSERVIELSENKKVIFGIRHEGGNVNLPFVQVTPNFEISREQLLELYSDKLKDYFSIFNPLQIRFWSKRKLESCLVGATYLVSTHGQMSELNEWPSEKDLSFKNVEDDSYYEWYKSGYDDFHTEQDDLKDRVTVNSKEVMKGSVEDGLLKTVFLDGKKIGLIAAEKSKFLGHDGIYFNEIFLDKAFKRRGFAKAIQRKFVEEFSDGNDFIWGTIDYQNVPSYKTAVSNGRKPIRFECFISI